METTPEVNRNESQFALRHCFQSDFRRDFSSKPEIDESHLVLDQDCDIGAPNQPLQYGFALPSKSVDYHYHPTTKQAPDLKSPGLFSESSPSISIGCDSTYRVALMVPTSKKFTKSKRFFRMQSPELFWEGFLKLIQRYDKCLIVLGKYVEK
ncbi:hypothetical protein TNCV_1997741 [Trichonephila clavipes]|uniref:Uncharacterized protein n=1 Tax=Trichonephila clavipes TaxID=2585209 RepID=A0A8X6RQ79_TRICX|nr:hypothetical protein TNCV_1997741 [Trichonephila clavipes]